MKTCYLTDRVIRQESNEEEQWGWLKELLTIFYSRGLESSHIERREGRDKMKEKLATGPAKYSHTHQRLLYVAVLTLTEDTVGRKILTLSGKVLTMNSKYQ